MKKRARSRRREARSVRDRQRATTRHVRPEVRSPRATRSKPWRASESASGSSQPPSGPTARRARSPAGTARSASPAAARAVGGRRAPAGAAGEQPAQTGRVFGRRPTRASAYWATECDARLDARHEPRAGRGQRAPCPRRRAPAGWRATRRASSAAGDEPLVVLGGQRARAAHVDPARRRARLDASTHRALAPAPNCSEPRLASSRSTARRGAAVCA